MDALGNNEVADIDWPTLAPKIDTMVRRIARKLNMSPLTRDDFLQDANGWIFQQSKHFDAAKGEFLGWCYRVLVNHGKSLIAKGATRQKLMSRLQDRARGSHGQGSEIAPNRRDDIDDLPQIDSAGALGRYASGLDRIIVALDCQLLGSISPETVSGWLEDADLPTDFPWQDLESIENQADRRKALATSLGQQAAWLRQRIRRTLQKLRDAMGAN